MKTSERARRLAACAVGLGLVYAVGAWIFSFDPPRLPLEYWYYSRVLWTKGAWLAAAVFLVALAPEGRARSTQTAVVILLFFFMRLELDHPWRTLVVTGLPLLLSVLLWAVPLERLGVRKGLVLMGALLPLVLWLVEQRVAGYDYVLMTLSFQSAAQFIMVADSFSRLGKRMPFTEVLRAMSTVLVMDRMALPTSYMSTTDRSPRTILSGAAWMAGGILMVQGSLSLGVLELNPVEHLLRGRWLAALAECLAFWTLVMTYWVGFCGVAAGALRMLGIPMNAPVDRPWLARNFAEYWRRSNVWNYLLLNRAFFQNFGAPTGRWMPLSVLGVFLVSGMALHIDPETGLSGLTMGRWAAEGLGTGLTLLYLQQAARRRVTRFVANRTPRPNANRWWMGGVTVACVLMMLTGHGLLLYHNYMIADVEKTLRADRDQHLLPTSTPPGSRAER